MTYYYALYENDYYGFQYAGKSETLKNALKGLRNALRDSAGTATGAVFDSPKIPERPMSRPSKNFVGSMIVAFGEKKTGITVAGRKTMIPESIYIWTQKGKRTRSLVKSDGSLTPFKKRL